MQTVGIQNICGPILVCADLTKDQHRGTGYRIALQILVKGGVDVLFEILRRNIFAAEKAYDLTAGHVLRQGLGLQKEIGGTLQKYSLTGDLPRLLLNSPYLHATLRIVRLCGDFLHHLAQPGLSGKRGTLPKCR